MTTAAPPSKKAANKKTGAPKGKPKIGLGAVRNAKKKAPDRILLYGVEGIGKSTWAASAPKPIFIAAEDGVNHLDVDAFENPRPSSYQDVLDAIDSLAQEEHDYKTLVIDTLDWTEHLVRDKVIAEHKTKGGRAWTAKDYYDYGRGLNISAQEFRKMLEKLEYLQRTKGMEVILIAHAEIHNAPNPAGEDYLRFKPKIGGKVIPDLFKEWCEAVLFAHYDDEIEKPERGTAKAGKSGERVVHTARCGAWDAKNRHGLPPMLELNYDDYVHFRDREESATIEELRGEIERLQSELSIDEEQAKKLAAWIKKAGDNPARLTKVEHWLRDQVEEQKGDS